MNTEPQKADVVLPPVARLEDITETGSYRLPTGIVNATLPSPGSSGPRRYDVFDAAGQIVQQTCEKDGVWYERQRLPDAWADWSRLD